MAEHDTWDDLNGDKEVVVIPMTEELDATIRRMREQNAPYFRKGGPLNPDAREAPTRRHSRGVTAPRRWFGR